MAEFESNSVKLMTLVLQLKQYMKILKRYIENTIALLKVNLVEGFINILNNFDDNIRFMKSNPNYRF